MGFICRLCCCCCCGSDNKKKNKDSKDSFMTGLAKKLSPALTLASSPSLLPTTDITLVYELPNQEFKTDEDVIRLHNYKIIYTEKIGQGVSGNVYKARDLNDGSLVACKRMEMGFGRKASKKMSVKNEIFVMEKTSHPHIIKVYRHFIIKNISTDRTYVYIFMRLAENLSLSNVIRQMKTGFDESTARRMFAQMVHAVAHMHALGIAHRDLKMGNILLDKDMNVMISDFGLSRVAFRQSRGGTIKSCTYAGTVSYMAPEILTIKAQGRRPYDPFPADVWALGVILYTMINKAYPFGQKEAPQEVINRQLRFETSNMVLNRYTTPSPEYVNVVRRIFTYDSEQRIKIKELLTHIWIKHEIQAIDEKIEFAPKVD